MSGARFRLQAAIAPIGLFAWLGLRNGRDAGRAAGIGRLVIVIAPVQGFAGNHLGDLVAGQCLVFKKTLRQPIQLIVPLRQDTLGRLIPLVHNLLDLLVDALLHIYGMPRAAAIRAQIAMLLIGVINHAQLFGKAVLRDHRPRDLRGLLNIR